MLSDNQVLNQLLSADLSGLKEPEAPQAGQPASAPTPAPAVVNNTSPVAETVSVLGLSDSSNQIQTLSSLGGNWTEENSTASASFSFTKLSKATRFLYSVLAEACGADYEGISLSLAPDEQNWGVNLSLGLASGELSDKDLLIGQFASYAYTKISVGSSYYYDDYYSERKLEDKESLREPLTESSKDYSWVQTLNDKGVEVDADKRLIKVPFAILGSWKHPVYKQVTFTQKDFDEMQQNFKDAVLGFEPPLFLGHPVDTDTTEGHPAEAFLQSLAQEGDVLYGLFEAVNDATYANVALGRYRYCSGEFVRNYPSKKDGKSVGTVVMGVALTNRPFLPGLPHVKALSEPKEGSTEQLSCVIKLSDTRPMTDTTTANTPVEAPESSSQPQAMSNPTQTQPEQPQVQPVVPQSQTQLSDAVNSESFGNFKQQVLTQFTEMKEAYTAQLNAYQEKLTATEQALATVQEEKEALKTEVAAIQQRHKQAEIDRKVAELETFAIPVEEKEKYAQLIKDGSLGDQEEVILATLRSMSTLRAESALTQRGVTTSTKALNAELAEGEDPYAETIKRNHELAEARAKNLQTLLS